MPTVVIMDVSASMLRPADISDPSTTRQDVAQRGILHLLNHLEQWHEFEPVCMMSMSSSCQILVPFGKKASANHKELRTSLYGMDAEDTANVSQAVRTACNVLQDNYSRNAQGCQVVLVVDGGPGLSEMKRLQRTIPTLSRAVIFHTIAMGSEEELQRCELYKTLAQGSNGSFRDVRLPKDITTYKRAFADLAHAFYQPLRAGLHCGHLQTPIQLYPDPNLGVNLSEHQGGVWGGGKDGERSEGAAGGGGGRVPAVLALRGCIPRELLLVDLPDAPLVPSFFKIAVASRHIVVPDTRRLGATPSKSAPNPHTHTHTACASGSGSASLLHLVLVIPKIGADTGTPQLERLAVTPFCDMASLVKLGVCLTSAASDAEEVKEKKNKKDTVKDESLATPDTLQSDLQKLFKFAAQLPGKKDAVYKECERLRKCAHVHRLPTVREAVLVVLEASELLASSPGEDEEYKEALFYMRDLSSQLRREDLSQPIIAPSYEPDQNKRASNRASLTNLLA